MNLRKVSVDSIQKALDADKSKYENDEWWREILELTLLIKGEHGECYLDSKSVSFVNEFCED